MKRNTITITEARRQFLKLPEILKGSETRVLEVTRDGKPELAVLPWVDLEIFVETIEILSDPEMMEQVRRGRGDTAGGRTVSLEEVERRYCV